jgi:pseudouridine-5'-phosphate glycosidase
VAAVLRARAEIGAPAGVVVSNALPADEQLDPELHARVLAESLAAADEQGVAGKDLTPFLLERFHSDTDGASLRVNTRLVVRNAALSGEIAVALAS